jgi:Domain of unknown function (DUF5658)
MAGDEDQFWLRISSLTNKSVIASKKVPRIEYRDRYYGVQPYKSHTLAAVMLLIVFILLQVLDALTTVVFLRLGVAEGNPLIRRILAAAAGQTAALIAPKLFAVSLGIFAWRTGRKRLLLKMDVLFALAVAWNTLNIFLKF